MQKKYFRSSIFPYILVFNKFQKQLMSKATFVKIRDWLNKLWYSHAIKFMLGRMIFKGMENYHNVSLIIKL